jgi:hypothetical protein
MKLMMKTKTSPVRHRRPVGAVWGLAAAVVTLWPLASQAAEPPVPDTVAAPVVSAPVPPAAAAAPGKRTRFALGASFGFVRRRDVGQEIETLFVPSIVGLAYFRVAPRVYLRPGLRLGLATDQPDTASDARIREGGILGRAEVGVLYDAWLVPALSVGAGFEARVISFVGDGVAQPSSQADRNELLGQFYGQFGLGLPLFHGFMVVEPYARIFHVFTDDRANSELGFDVTFAL